MEDAGINQVRKLDDSQVEAFDTEYVNGARWDSVRAVISKDFPDGDFTFLDVGGGNGKFADRLLDEYPRARGTVFDNSQVLIDRNVPHDRKTTICDTIERLHLYRQSYDIICIHWVLHHLVGESYRETRHNQAAALRSVSKQLTPRGRISVYENVCEGWVSDSLPGRMIYLLSSSKTVARVAKRFGSNTAGIGVCYLSAKEWGITMAKAGLEVCTFVQPDQYVWPLRPSWRVLLHMRRMRVALFWLRVLPTTT